MPELSNSVRQRLGARPVPPIHPDADTLTAYVEQMLPTGERSQVVEHLAACPACREVVFISSSVPNLPEKTMIQGMPAPSRFWTFGFRWAGALAVLAIAVALVIERPRQKTPSAQTPAATLAVTPHADSANTQKAAEPVQLENASSALTTSEAAANRSVPQPPNTRPSATSGAQSDLSRVSRTSVPPMPRPDNAARNEALDDKEAKGALRSTSVSTVGLIQESHTPPTPAPAQKKGFVNSNLIFAADEHYLGNYKDAVQEKAKADAERAKKEQVVFASGPQNPELDANTRKSFLRKALPLGAIAAGVVKLANMGAPPASDAPAGERAGGASTFAAPVRPLISPRSVTGTATAITHDSAETRRAKTASSEPLHWRVQDGKLVNSADLNQWHEAYPQSDQIEFKVVQAQGHDVWAGGTNGTLVHSWDGGVDWQKFNVGDAASGDIEKISLSGGDVQVKTSNGQHFISRDGGKTWAPLNSQAKPESNQPK
jgi:hypothetical protein